MDKVQDWPIPTNTKEVHSFLGLASYYWRFIPKFAKIPQCLHELVGPTSNKHKKARGQRKGKLAASIEITEPREHKWMPEHQQAFDALKEALVTTPVLGYPDFNRKFMLETNASLQGLGAVLSQQDETRKLHVIAYASQSLHPSERSMPNYSSAKLVLLVLKWAVTEKIVTICYTWNFTFTQTIFLWLMSERASLVHLKFGGWVCWSYLISQSTIKLEGPTEPLMDWLGIHT